MSFVAFCLAWDVYERMGGSAVWVGLQHVTGGDNHAPASPDGTGGHKSTVLCQGKFLSRTTEVGDTSDDQTPLFVDSLTYVSLGPFIYGVYPHPPIYKKKAIPHSSID